MAFQMRSTAIASSLTSLDFGLRSEPGSNLLMNGPIVEHEHRFLLTSQEARQFVRAVSARLTLDVYDALRPVAYSHTTYYDTPKRELWNDELTGAGHRVRVRQYASAEDPTSEARFADRVYLELKSSTDSRRQKLRFPFLPEQLRDLLQEGSTADLPDSSTARALVTRIRTAELSPVFSTWYRRMSMSQGKVRVTIDENVAFCPPCAFADAGQAKSPSDALGMITGRVVEIKVRGAMPDWLATAMASLGGSESVSKFRRGMQILLSPSRDKMNSTRPLTALPPMQTRGYE